MHFDDDEDKHTPVYTPPLTLTATTSQMLGREREREKGSKLLSGASLYMKITVEVGERC